MQPQSRREIPKDLAAFASGTLFTLSLSPFDFWPAALVVPALLFFLTSSCSTGRVLLRFYLFNVGLYAAGVSWIYVSVHEYGGAGPLLAGSLVMLLVLAYSLLCLPQAYLFGRYLRGSLPLAVPGFAGCWVLQEWFRTWILTGFPWLYSGYGMIDTPLANLAPMLGVFGVSLATVLLSLSIYVVLANRAWYWIAVPVLLAPLMFLDADRWTTGERTVSVALVQGNVDQHTKWYRANQRAIFDQYNNLSSQEWGRQLVIWPEASLTYFREDALPLLNRLDRQAQVNGTTLVLGLPDRDQAGGFQNTVIALGNGKGQYIKRRLVPFGEYVPLESYLRGIIRLFDLPMSRNMSGPAEQPALLAGDLRLSVSICYEVIYPELVRSAVQDPDLLVTVSNDTWFGTSIGPWQHLQMARMRSLENGRSMLRATNSGVTALIDHRGEVTDTLPQFESGVLRGEVTIREGRTPYHRWGDTPVLLICLLLIVLPFGWRYFRRG